jgi:hypothetical protein
MVQAPARFRLRRSGGRACPIRQVNARGKVSSGVVDVVNKTQRAPPRLQPSLFIALKVASRRNCAISKSSTARTRTASG